MPWRYNRPSAPATEASPDWPSRFVRLVDQTRDSRIKTYYQAGCVDPDTPIQSVRFLALDLETTGMNPDTDAIVSIGCIPLFHDRIVCSGAFHRPNVFQRWLGEENSPSLRLAHARERYNLPPYHPHHALTDALATAELFLAQAADRYPPDTPVSALWH